jgi:hypothetical protein
VPFEFPSARGGLPLPLQLVSGTRGVGAAGLGWDIPLSYVGRDASFAHRRPAIGSDVAPQARTQVSLSHQGRRMQLVPKGSVWVSQHDSPELTLRELNGTWVMYDGRGLTYVFTKPPALAAAGLWLLESIKGPGGAAVELEYNITTPGLPGAPGVFGVSIDLVRIQYNFLVEQIGTQLKRGCAKDEVTLTYDEPSPLSISLLDDVALARTHILSAIDVMSRATCTSTAQKLRRYEFPPYLLDADTQQPRLHTVQMFGRQGTAEENTAVPIASYQYGSASHGGKLLYQKTQTIPLPAGADVTQISSTVANSINIGPGVSSGIPYVTWQSLTDVTGDGRPDLIFSKNGKLWVARNLPAAGGSTAFGTIGQLSDGLATGAFEHRSLAQGRFNYNLTGVNVDQVWRQAIDVNGDGRVDIIDAAEEPGHWVVYLNTPGPGPSGVRWVKLSFSIDKLYHHLQIRGHDVQDGYLPLARRITGRHQVSVSACWKWNGHDWVNGSPEGPCTVHSPQELMPEATYTEWELKDLNGDGYPDFVFNSSRVDWTLCCKPDPWQPGEPTIRNGNIRSTLEPKAREGNNVDAVFNLRGVFFDVNTNPFSSPVTIRQGTICGVAEWAVGGGFQEAICDIADINGDGLADRIENHHDVFLGTGSGFSKVQLTLPGSLATQVSDHDQACIKTPPTPPPRHRPNSAREVSSALETSMVTAFPITSNLAISTILRQPLGGSISALARASPRRYLSRVTSEFLGRSNAVMASSLTPRLDSTTSTATASLSSWSSTGEPSMCINSRAAAGLEHQKQDAWSRSTTATAPSRRLPIARRRKMAPLRIKCLLPK